MAAQPTDPKNAPKKPETKKTETVLLSADELRRLSGGATIPPSSPVPKTGNKITSS